MYKLLKNCLILFVFAILTGLSIWYVKSNSQNYIPSGKGTAVSVTKARLDLHRELEQIANQTHVIIAKTIYVKEDNRLGTSLTRYEKIGVGNLPKIYKEEKNKTLLSNAFDNTDYYVIGDGITPKALSNQLNILGNETSTYSIDVRFGILILLKSFYLIPCIIVLICFSALLLAEYISNLKADGIRRLAGIEKWRLAFGSIGRDIIFISISGLLFAMLGSVLLKLCATFSIYYLEMLWITLLAGAICLILLIFFLSLLVLYLLQSQPIQFSVKGRSPMTLIVFIVIVFQIFAVLSSMSSIQNLMAASRQLSELQEGQNVWAENKQYFGTTLMREAETRQEKQNFNAFTKVLLENPETILSKTNFNDSAVLGESGYVLNPPKVLNSITVNEKFLKKSGIKLSQRIENEISRLGEGEYALLIPESQKKKAFAIESTWSSIQMSLGLNASSSVTTTYDAKNPIFAYDLKTPNTSISPKSFADSPVIVVYSPQTFSNSENNYETTYNINAMYLSNSNIEITNKAWGNQLIEKYHLEKLVGSFVNGYAGISAKVSITANQRNLLLGVNFLCILSSLLLISLLNSIYLYQNRKMFLIQRLAGKKWMDIHMVYLAVVLTLTAVISGIARVWLHVPNEAFLVPIVYVGLVLILFVAQMNKEKTANVLYLKGF